MKKSVFQSRKFLDSALAVGIFLPIFLYTSFFLQGLNLYDNDYNLWIRLARENSLIKILWQVFDPILSEWNTTFRPFEVLVFKGLFSSFGYASSGYYYFKSFMIALYCLFYFFFLSRWLQNKMIGVLSALFLGMSSSTFTSLFWVSDFVVVSEFFALLVYALFLNLEFNEGSQRRSSVITTLVLMFVFTLICDRTKANGKLIPAILFLYILIVDWRKLKRYGPLLFFMIFSLLPLRVLLKNPIPPFIHAASGTYESYVWQPASLRKLWHLFSGDFQPLSLIYPEFPPISIMAIIGFPLVYAALLSSVVLVAIYVLWKKVSPSSDNLLETSREGEEKKGLIFIFLWASFNILALMSYPTLYPEFQARYAISVLVPLMPLILVAIQRATETLATVRRTFSATLVTSLIVLQIVLHAYHTFRLRNYFPTYMISSINLMEYISHNFRNKVFYFFNEGVPIFRPTHEGNQFISSLQEPDLIRAAKDRHAELSDVYFISRVHISSPSFEFLKFFPGKSDSLFDEIFNSGEHPYYFCSFYLYTLR